MKTSLVIASIYYFLISPVLIGMELKAGIKISEFESEMNKNGYKSTSCGQIISAVDGGDIKCFSVDKGTLFVTYLVSNQTVFKLSYRVDNKNSKGDRLTLSLDVIGFNPENGEMRVTTDKPKKPSK